VRGSGNGGEADISNWFCVEYFGWQEEWKWFDRRVRKEFASCCGVNLATCGGGFTARGEEWRADSEACLIGGGSGTKENLADTKAGRCYRGIRGRR
jgi:hypothetical protein